MRFVILEHLGAANAHLDLMIEDPSDPFGLRTWSLQGIPEYGWQPARCLGTHRRAYLTYQGPVLLSRGWVRRVDSGDCAILFDSPGEVRLLLRGESEHRVLDLERRVEGATQTWRCRVNWRWVRNPRGGNGC